MKIRLAILTFALGTLCTAYERTTSEIAAAEHYDAFITKYRNKSEMLLNSILIETKLRIQKLALQNLFHRAEALEASYTSNYERMQDTIDTFFINFDNEFLINAQKLDDEGAPEKTKVALIAAMKEKIGRAFSALFEFYSRKFNILELQDKKIAEYEPHVPSVLPKGPTKHTN